MLLLLSSGLSMRVRSPPLSSEASRRTALTHFFAASLALPPLAALAEPPQDAVLTSKQKRKAELAAAMAARKEEERVSELPITKLKLAREQIAGCEKLIEEGEWEELRGMFVNSLRLL